MIKRISVIVISMAIVLWITACGKENISDDSKIIWKRFIL